MMPRTLLMRCDAVRRRCLAEGAVAACDDLGAVVPPAPLARPDTEFDLAAARDAADIAGIRSDEDAWLGQLLRDVFDLYALEDEPDDTLDVASKGEPDQRIPPLHGRLIFIHHDENDRERHVCYRALQHQNAIAFQARLRAALTASGISARIPDRDLLLVRRGPMPGGAKTKQLVEAFTAAGGRAIDPADADLRVFVGLRDLHAWAQAEGVTDRFERWIRAEQPLVKTAFFRDAGLDHAGGGGAIPAAPDARSDAEGPADRPAAPEGAPKAAPEAAPKAGPGPSAADKPGSPPAPAEGPAPATAPGRDPGRPSAHPRRAPPSACRCACCPATHGDHRGLGLRQDRAPAPPRRGGRPGGAPGHRNRPQQRSLAARATRGRSGRRGFSPEDDRKAAVYAERVRGRGCGRPGVHAGNPLFLSVLPDFAELGADRDERQQAIEMAAETLGPLAGAKTNLLRGGPGRRAPSFRRPGRGASSAPSSPLLADLPDGTSEIGQGRQARGRHGGPAPRRGGHEPAPEGGGHGARPAAPVLRARPGAHPHLGDQPVGAGLGGGPGGFREPAPDDAVRLDQEEPVAPRHALRGRRGADLPARPAGVAEPRQRHQARGAGAASTGSG